MEQLSPKSQARSSAENLALHYKDWKQYRRAERQVGQVLGWKTPILRSRPSQQIVAAVEIRVRSCLSRFCQGFNRP
jgi:hypothetical protein